jgi:hypothetical protein
MLFRRNAAGRLRGCSVALCLAVLSGGAGAQPASLPTFPVPGATIASLELQRDAVNYILTGVEGVFLRKSCKAYAVKDTEIRQPYTDANTPWRERWTFERCGATVKYDITFVPGEKGGKKGIYVLVPTRRCPTVDEIQPNCPALADAFPPDQLPMFGMRERERSAAGRAADAEFVASVVKQGVPRAAAAAQLLREGWTLWDRRDPTGAMLRFNQAWLLDPDNGDTYHGFAVVMGTRGASVEYIGELYARAMALSKDDPRLLVDYGRHLWGMASYDESLAAFQRALALNPNAPGAKAGIAYVHYRKDNFLEACKWAVQAHEGGDAMDKGFVEDMCGRAGRLPGAAR